MEFVALWLLLSIAAGVVAGAKGRSGFGWFLLSLMLLGFLGLILAAVLPAIDRTEPIDGGPADQRRCPHCRTPIHKDAFVCRHCGRDVAAPPTIAGADKPALKTAKPGRRRLRRLAGSDLFEVEIVGESFRQRELAEICGGKCEDGHEHYAAAMLRPETDNPHDSQAVAVLIDGLAVGHLSRPDARRYRRALELLGAAGETLECEAVIVGGWDRGDGDEGQFGVRLDIDSPLRIEG